MLTRARKRRHDESERREKEVCNICKRPRQPVTEPWFAFDETQGQRIDLALKRETARDLFLLRIRKAMENAVRKCTVNVKLELVMPQDM